MGFFERHYVKVPGLNKMKSNPRLCEIGQALDNPWMSMEGVPVRDMANAYRVNRYNDARSEECAKRGAEAGKQIYNDMSEAIHRRHTPPAP